MAKPMAVNANDFEAQVISSPVPVLVDFWAPWCGPCRMMAPVLDQVAAEYGDRVKVAKLNVDENPSLADRYNVMSIPTLLLFVDGRPVAQSVGYTPRGQLKQMVDRFLVTA